MAEPVHEEIKARVEAILFSFGKSISIQDIARLARITQLLEIELCLNELKSEYDARHSPLMIYSQGDFWKVGVREQYLAFVKKIVAQTELSKTVMETLSIIAWKSPVLQSEVIDLRTNKAYDHIDALEQAGFLVKEKHGRSYLLKLTQKFFDYFDIKDENELKQRFERFKDKVITKKFPPKSAEGFP